jgi:hypothetical protein
MKDTCYDFFQKEDIKLCIKEFLRPIVIIIYNEIYPYLWLICLYNVFLFIITLANLYLLTRLIRK